MKQKHGRRKDYIMSDRIGQQLGGYRLVELIGKGGYAEVYLGKHLHLTGLQAAIKVLTEANLKDEERENFRREASTIRKLSHPHIVRLIDFGIQSNRFGADTSTPFFIMEYATNGTLRTLYPEGISVPFERILVYVKQMADALQYAHNQGIIHRDVKPENMLVHKSDHIWLSDFGIAVANYNTENLDLQRQQLIELMQKGGKPGDIPIPGSVAYIAPERLDGVNQRASDQYSLGVVVYEWLTGVWPFQGDKMQILYKLLTDPPPPLYGKYPQITREIEDVVMKALSKEPKERFPGVEDFADKLGAALNAAMRAPQNSVVEVQRRPVALAEQKSVKEEKGEELAEELPSTPAEAEISAEEEEQFENTVQVRSTPPEQATAEDAPVGGLETPLSLVESVKSVVAGATEDFEESEDNLVSHHASLIIPNKPEETGVDEEHTPEETLIADQPEYGEGAKVPESLGELGEQTIPVNQPAPSATLKAQKRPTISPILEEPPTDVQVVQGSQITPRSPQSSRASTRRQQKLTGSDEHESSLTSEQGQQVRSGSQLQQIPPARAGRRNQQQARPRPQVQPRSIGLSEQRQDPVGAQSPTWYTKEQSGGNVPVASGPHAAQTIPNISSNANVHAHRHNVPPTQTQKSQYGEGFIGTWSWFFAQTSGKYQNIRDILFDPQFARKRDYLRFRRLFYLSLIPLGILISWQQANILLLVLIVAAWLCFRYCIRAVSEILAGLLATALAGYWFLGGKALGDIGVSVPRFGQINSWFIGAIFAVVAFFSLVRYIRHKLD
jgi:serine/threonine protein kinase